MIKKLNYNQIKTRYNPKIYYFKDGENFEKISKNRKCKKLIFILKGNYYKSFIIKDDFTTIKAYKPSGAFIFFELDIQANIVNVSNITFMNGIKLEN